MPSIRRYVSRGPRKSERRRVEHADAAARVLLNAHPELQEVEIFLRNARNPNGFSVRRERFKTESKVERFISMGWARQHGYR